MIRGPHVTKAPADDPLRLLAGFPLFSTLPPETAAELALRLRPVDVRCGEALVKQGEPGDSLFLVVDGRFEARAEQPSGPARVIGVIGRGETIGEMAVITAEPRSCSVVAARRSSVLELSGEDFRRILEQHPGELLALTRRIVQRSTKPTVSSPIRRVALLPLDARTDLSWLVKTLGEALSRFGPSIVLGRAHALAQVGTAEADGTVPRLSARFLEWLAEQERSHELVVYEAMHRLGEWTHRCLAQADLVVLVGNADEPPDLTVLEREMLGPESAVTLAPRHLVLLRSDRARRPSGTARWLDARQIALHHHVASGDKGDVERLARIVTGRAVSLVLSGGGVRGFAGIGVMRAFEEAGLPVDLVGGASIGSVTAGLRAMEWGAARMHEECKRILAGKRSAMDLTFPFVSLFAARRGSRAVRAMCDGWSIEDLPIGYFAVSADLCQAEEVVHRRGPLWLAMRASGSIPGVFPPVITGDRCLVDGGVLNNLPVDVMARLASGRIVAVDVSREIALDLQSARAIDAADASASGWRLLLRRLNPFRRREPRLLHIGDVLARSSEVAAVRIGRTVQERTPITLRIEPPVDGYRMLDFASIDPIVEAGYRHAAEHVEAWKRELLAG
jgi:predicted acylesterase/phospholipase RssA